ncbi:MAG: 50S ribosomal protein L2 [Oligoflexia bacterium]|nr:50S ribosomal protein L2 [Bdellovibrionales bacterium]MYE07375.1 50S ribosomal protein L2 [Oligoflexia bacterium]
MGIRVLKPRTPATRKMSVSDFKEITKGKPEKALTRPLKKKAARNNRGRITVRHRGGGHKRSYRLIDFKRLKTDIPARVVAIEYDPNRSCRIALIAYKDGFRSYILAPVDLNPGQEVISSDTADIKPGNSLPLNKIPTGTEIHNIELRPGKGGQLVRSAGVGAVLAAKDKKYCQVKMPSGELRRILSLCRASIGKLGNADNENIRWGKAGRIRKRGWRPKVRGMAMNPIDHPMGGGEGVGKGNHPMTPWGKSCKGYRTRNNKRTDRMIIRRRYAKEAKN